MKNKNKEEKLCEWQIILHVLSHFTFHIGRHSISMLYFTMYRSAALRSHNKITRPNICEAIYFIFLSLTHSTLVLFFPFVFGLEEKKNLE